jgi:hypothetical protein
MLCESLCQRSSSWEGVLLSSVHFSEVMFQWFGYFFLKLISQIKESASNFASVFKKTATETRWMLQEAFRDNAMSQSKTFLLCKCFKDGRTSVDNDERYPQCLWDSRTVIRDRSTHFGGQFENKTHFCKICAMTAERWPEGPLHFCLHWMSDAESSPCSITNNGFRNDRLDAQLVNTYRNGARIFLMICRYKSFLNKQ